jgi:hypothetical protein
MFEFPRANIFFGLPIGLSWVRLCLILRLWLVPLLVLVPLLFLGELFYSVPVALGAPRLLSVLGLRLGFRSPNLSFVRLIILLILLIFCHFLIMLIILVLLFLSVFLDLVLLHLYLCFDMLHVLVIQRDISVTNPHDRSMGSFNILTARQG